METIVAGWMHFKADNILTDRREYRTEERLHHNGVILHYFLQLADQPQSADTRYVLTLLMMRRRLLRLEATETDDQGRELLLLFCPKNENEYVIPVMEPVGDRVNEIQEALSRLLFADAT